MTKPGRPTDDPKELNTRVRLSGSDKSKLEFASKKLGITKAEVIRRGINEMYNKAKG